MRRLRPASPCWTLSFSMMSRPSGGRVMANRAAALSMTIMANSMPKSLGVVLKLSAQLAGHEVAIDGEDVEAAFIEVLAGEVTPVLDHGDIGVQGADRVLDGDEGDVALHCAIAEPVVVGGDAAQHVKRSGGLA